MYCAKFKDVFPFIKNGANIKQDENAGGIPITRIETLAGGEFNTSRLGYANIFDISPYYEYVLNSGDILMSHINSPAYLGRAVVFEDKYDIVIHGMNLLRLKANKELIDSRYAVYLFSGNIFKEHIRKITKKSVNQASFSINDLKKIELQLPSIENQVIIAEKLDKLKMLIKKKNRLILFLDEIIKSRFVEMFGDPVINNKKWTSMNLQEISIKITSGNTPQGGSRVYINHGVLFIRSQNVWNNRLDLDDVVYISESLNEKMKETRLRRNDLLITKTGRFNTENSSLGRCALYTGPDFQANINGHVYLVRLKSEYNPNFILSILTSETYKNLIRTVCVGGIDKRQLNKSHIELFPIIIPPIELQNQYVQFLLKINKLKSDVQKSIDETQLLMDSLMQEYFG